MIYGGQWGLWGLQWLQHPKAICSDLISFLIAACTGCWKCLKVRVQKGRRCIIFEFFPSVMQNKQRTCWVWKQEVVKMSVYLNYASFKWLSFTLYCTTATAQNDTEDVQNPLGFFILRYLSTWFCFIAQQMFMLC